MKQKLLEIASRRPFLLFACYALFLAWDLIILQEAAVIGGHDILNSALPYLKNLASLVMSHGPVGWFPSMGCGLPFLNHGLVWWRPENLFYFILPAFWVYTVQYILATFVAGWGTYLFLKNSLDLSTGTCLVAGMIAVNYIFFIPEVTTVAGIPLFLYCFDQWVLSPRFKRALPYIAGCLYYLLSCNLILAQPHAFLFHLTVVCSFLYSKRYSFRAAGLFLVSWGFYALSQLPMIFNLLLELPESIRSTLNFPVDTGISSPFLGAHLNVFVLSVALFGAVYSLRYGWNRLYSLWFLSVLPVKYLWEIVAGPIHFFQRFQCRIGWLYPILLVFTFALGLEAIMCQERQLNRKISNISVFTGIALGILLMSLRISQSLLDLLFLTIGVCLSVLFIVSLKKLPFS